MEEQSSMPISENQSRKRRRKFQRDSTASSSPNGRTPWRTETEQQIYSSKLVDELRRLRRPESSSAVVRTVRNAADRVLAASAKGRTRWSRAILSGRLRARLSQINRKHRKATRPNGSLKRPAGEEKKKKLPPLQQKVRVLSRLVPGCRKLPLPNLLEETTDYIAALEMQVKAMTFLAGLLNGTVPSD